MKAMRKDPARRYASAEAFSEDLFRHLEGLPVLARRGAWSYRAGRFVLRHRAVVGVVSPARQAPLADPPDTVAVTDAELAAERPWVELAASGCHDVVAAPRSLPPDAGWYVNEAFGSNCF